MSSGPVPHSRALASEAHAAPEGQAESMIALMTLLELPTDRPRAAVRSHAGGSVPFVLSPELANGLRGLSQRHGTTLFTTVLAGWSVLMSRLGGQDEVAIGTRVANHQRVESESLIGALSDTPTLRISPQGASSVAELLAQVRTTTLHQDAPSKQAAKALQSARSRDHSPVFRAMLLLDDTPGGDAAELPGLALSAVETTHMTSHPDLTLSLSAAGDELAGRLHYASDLFDAQTIERWSRHLVTLLEAMVADDHQRVSALPLLDAEQRRQLLVAFNDAVAAYPREQLVHQLFEQQVQADPAAIAVVYQDRTLTYGELNCRANRLAHRLIELGVRPDDRVAVCMERSLEMVIGLLGILKAGGAYVPLDPAVPMDRLVYMLEDSAPAALVSHVDQRELVRSALATIAGLPTIELGGAEAEQPATAPDHNPVASALGLTTTHLAYVLYTSGSTGVPKGVEMPHRALVNLLGWQARHSGISTRHVLQFSALGFDVAFQEIFSTLTSGGTLRLLDESIRRDPVRLAEFIRDSKVETIFLPFVALQGLVAAAQQVEGALDHLTDVVTAGEQLLASPAIRAAFVASTGRRLHNHYGPTETHVASTLLLPPDSECWEDRPSIGRPIGNTCIYVLDAAGQLAPLGVVGEICIGGAGVARGYRNRPDLTAERFVRDPFAPDPDARMYRTGDLGRWRADGTLEYVGRNDFQVKIRGFRVELGEIEATLARHPAVGNAVVVAREDVPGERKLVAYVVPNGPLPSASDLREHLSATLPDYMVPANFVRMDAMPVTPNGKLDRTALPAPGRDRPTLSSQHEAGRDALEQGLCELFGEVLRIDGVGRLDSFFELGGDSVQAIWMVERIRRMDAARINTTGASRVAVTTVLAHPTPAALAAALRKEEGEATQRPNQAGQADAGATKRVGVATYDLRQPPRPDARLGRDAQGNPAWFIPNPDAPGKFMKLSP
ncbi:amino acid adenylation domain-containing protein [Lysobacter korlensis]|uniref:Amino acid adenylation domain-containing protein n=1 Tax=Lysobacter korlensis TaxID=553636 RepID=A0ABV6RRH3_9GAMM